MQNAIVITGATSGFGAAALDIIVNQTDAAIIIGARSPDTLTKKYGDRITALPLDLSSLSSVEKFLNSVPETIAINALALNAGMSARKLRISEDGYEQSFQVNYLSHFVIYKALEQRLLPEARVLTTGSGTHDPEERTPIPTPRHADVFRLADPSTDPNKDRLGQRAAGRAYSSSKLCCILMAEEIARQRPNGTAFSFDPGFLPDTNLTREHPSVLVAMIKPVISMMMKNDRTGSIDSTARKYADLILGGESPTRNGGYVAMRSGELVAAEASQLAQTPGLARKFWEDTDALLERSTN